MRKRLISIAVSLLLMVGLINLTSSADNIENNCVSFESSTNGTFENIKIKYQLKDAGNETYGLRFLLIADEQEVKNINSVRMYISASNGVNSNVLEINRAYRSVIANGNTVMAGEGKVYLIGKFMCVPEELLDGITAHFQFGDSKFDRTISYGIFKNFALPTGFKKISSRIKVSTDGCNFKYDFDITKYKNRRGTTYYVAPNGTNVAKPTENNPTTLKYLLEREVLKDGDTVVFADGVYRDIVGANSEKRLINKSINLIAKNPGKVTIANIGAKLKYTSVGNGVYKTTRSNVVKIAQKMNEYFTTNELKKVSTLKECKKQGTWFVAGDKKTLYVHLYDDVKPDYENCFVLLNYSVPVIKSSNAQKNVNLYLEGINFVGGTPATVYFEGCKGFESNIYAKDCKFLHAYDSKLSFDAVSIKGANAFFENCYAGFSSKDGFNYHKYAGNVPSFIEVNCIGANNGVDGVAKAGGHYTQNGSTCHDGVKGLRIGGTYYNNYGGNVADVNENTETVNINCTAFNSAYTGNSASANADFVAQLPGTTMHLYNCRAYGSMTSALAVPGAKLNVVNCDLEKENKKLYEFVTVRNIKYCADLEQYMYFQPAVKDVEINKIPNVKVSGTGVCDNYGKQITEDNRCTIDGATLRISGTPKEFSNQNINALFIGDSLTEHAVYLKRIVKNFNDNGCNINLLGTNGIGRYKNEGYSGWRTYTFVNCANEMDDLDIIAKKDRKNPFYNPSVSGFDFNYYMKNNYANQDLDVVVIALGTNDNARSHFTSESEVTGYLRTMINSIKNYDSNIKILLWLPPNLGITENTSFKTFQKSFKYREYVLNGSFSDVELMPVYLAVSPYDDYNLQDYTHPSTQGYNNIGDFVTAYLL